MAQACERARHEPRKKWRAANAQSETVFLAGNHDFAFVACIGALPPPSVDDEVFEIAFLCNENEPYWEGELFSLEVEGGMHHQGRRWGAGDTYCNKALFVNCHCVGLKRIWCGVRCSKVRCGVVVFLRIAGTSCIHVVTHSVGPSIALWFCCWWWRRLCSDK